MYCDLFDCEGVHRRKDQPEVTRRFSMSYQKQILRSYAWIFHELASNSSRIEAYYDLPLPWWLTPLQSAQEQHVQGNNPRKGLFAWLGGAVDTAATFIHLKKPQPKKPHETIRTLLTDRSGRKCKLPIDCLVQLRPFDDEHIVITGGAASDEPYKDDSQDEEESLSIPHQVSYELYPALGDRIKILINHLEKQKPKGFVALWRDQRDSNTWYTFWAAVIFGVTALVLAAGSLALSGAQTWATFRALDLQREG
jgi:hypothetical protein